jgi:hypothetical protein
VTLPDEPSPQSSIILYQTEDGRTRIQCRFENETIWLTQALIAELFQKDVRTINEHLVNIFEEGELSREATIRKFRIVRLEGTREVAREVEHYRLEAILAVGYRVRSHRGTQFRQWATARLSEYLVKGFTMDDERLKNPPGKGYTDYFDELLERIRDIRSSERRFYQVGGAVRLRHQWKRHYAIDIETGEERDITSFPPLSPKRRLCRLNFGSARRADPTRGFTTGAGAPWSGSALRKMNTRSSPTYPYKWHGLSRRHQGPRL